MATEEWIGWKDAKPTEGQWTLVLAEGGTERCRQCTAMFEGPCWKFFVGATSTICLCIPCVEQVTGTA